MGFRQIKFLLVCCVLAFALGNSDALAQSLLKGATPSSLSVPSGWKVYGTHTFENCTLNSTLQEFAVSGAGCRTTQAHSGTHSEGGLVSGTSSPNWGYEFLPSTEVYVSWWEYLDSTARFNTEMITFHMLHNAGTFAEFVWDWYYESGTGNDFNRTTARLSAVQNGAHDQAEVFSRTTVPVGAWHQFEVHWKANTPGLNDGVSQIYQDGVLLQTVGPQNFNAGVNMVNSRFSLMGSYTKLMWYTNSSMSTCSSGEFGYNPPQPAAQCLNFAACACPPNPPTFNRYIDDIIVLVPGSGGGGDTTPPNPPTGLSFK